MASEMKSMYYDLISDAGEECDDELAIAFLRARCIYDTNLHVRVFCTNPIGKKNIIRMIGDSLANFELLDFTKDTFVQRNTGKKMPILVQIGPVTPEHIDMCDKYVKSGPFAYILLGELGNTLNSNKTAQKVAEFFITNSSHSTCIHTKGGAGAPFFTVGGLSSLSGPNGPLIEHMLKIGFRNTMGRAGASAGKFVAHLVAMFDGGANYQTCKRIADQLGIKSAPETWNKADDPVNKRHETIMAIVDSYITDLRKAPGIGLDVNDDGSTNSIRGVTHDQIRHGYAFILDTMNQAFDFPIDFFASQTPDRQWDKRWEFVQGGDKFTATYTTNEDTNKQVERAYDNWNELMKSNSTTETTPAYDLVAVRYGLEWCYSAERSPRFTCDWFQELSSTARHVEVVLKQSVRNLGVERLLTAPFPL